MLFCSSFTQSERFLQTDQVINFIRMLVGNVLVNVFTQVACSDLVGSDLLHLLIDVRQIAASVIVQELCDELLEEL